MDLKPAFGIIGYGNGRNNIRFILTSRLSIMVILCKIKFKTKRCQTRIFGKYMNIVMDITAAILPYNLYIPYHILDFLNINIFL